MTGQIKRLENSLDAIILDGLAEMADKAFKELAYEMTKFASIDPDVHAAYKKW